MTTITVPAEITLADVAAMGEADELHRYEMTDEGEVRIMVTPTPEHSRIVMRLTLWLARHGFTDEHLRTDLGIYTKGGASTRSDGLAGRGTGCWRRLRLRAGRRAPPRGRSRFTWIAAQ